MNEFHSVNYSSNDVITDVKPFNSNFDMGVLKVAYHGGNRKNSFISKETFEKAIPTLFNVPVVAHLIENAIDDNGSKGDFGDHDIEVVAERDSKNRITKIKVRRLTVPVGVVPESTNWWWEIIEDEQAGIREYFCCNVLLWKIANEYWKILELGKINHSMEIRVLNGEMKDDGYYHINDMEYKALCLLGTNVEPCYEGSSLELFSHDTDDFMQKLDDMLQDLKCSMTIVGNDFNKEKEVNSLNYVEQLKDTGFDVEYFESKFSLKLDDIDEETFVSKLEELKAETKSDGTLDDSFSLTSLQKLEAIREAVESLVYVNRWNENIRKYSLVDVDEDSSVAVVYDHQDNKLYGVSYSFNKDSCTVDFDNVTRKKITYSDFEDGSDDVIEQVFSEERKALNTKIEALENEIKDISDKFSITERENIELRDYKAKIVEESVYSEKVSVLKSFESDLNTSEEFMSLKESVTNKSDGFSDVDELKSFCFALIGKMYKEKQEQSQINFSLNLQSGVALPVDDNDGKTKAYNGFIERYKNK